MIIYQRHIPPTPWPDQMPRYLANGSIVSYVIHIVRYHRPQYSESTPSPIPWCWAFINPDVALLSDDLGDYSDYRRPWATTPYRLCTACVKKEQRALDRAESLRVSLSPEVTA